MPRVNMTMSSVTATTMQKKLERSWRDDSIFLENAADWAALLRGEWSRGPLR
jgi:hypothetical protein